LKPNILTVNKLSNDYDVRQHLLHYHWLDESFMSVHR